MEINEDKVNENKQRVFIKACYRKGVSHHPLCAAETQGQEEEGKSLCEEMEGFKSALIGDCWHGEARVANRKQDILCD